MPSPDRQAYLKFVAKITELASSYDTEDLMEFRRMSGRHMPLVADLVDVLLKLEERPQTGRTSLKSAKRVRHLSEFESSSASRNSARSAMDIFMDHRVFPANVDLQNFGRQFLGIDSARNTRSRLARRFVKAIEALSPPRRDNVELALRQLRNLSAHSAGSDFLARWERVIKGGKDSETPSPETN